MRVRVRGGGGGGRFISKGAFEFFEAKKMRQIDCEKAGIIHPPKRMTPQ